jgi:FMN reductase (NADPH)
MINNPTLEALMRRKSIRAYQEKAPSDEMLASVVRAGEQAPFSLQLCSVLLSRESGKHPFNAPWLFTICVDSHRLERVMAKRKWRLAINDLSLLFFGVQDAALLAQNMVIAAESLELGSCFIGNTPYIADKIVEQYQLPPRVFPLVQLTMGYPAEDPPPRPRYPLNFTLFEGKYPEFDDETLKQAMAVMDDGYLAEDYYRKADFMIPLQGGREETFDFASYSWTEHISRKVGQWLPLPRPLLKQLEKCGFDISGEMNIEE